MNVNDVPRGCPIFKVILYDDDINTLYDNANIHKLIYDINTKLVKVID